jgi:Spy/CpxP family protein refolding chaperone
MLGVRSRATLYLILIFFCGVLSGAVGMRWGQRLNVSADTTTTPQPGQVRRNAVAWFTQQLNLTPEQAGQLNKIVEETRAAYKEHELEIESLRQDGNARIRAILTDAQKPKFDQLLAARAAKEKEKEKEKAKHDAPPHP